jgi:hypothetical protein
MANIDAAQSLGQLISGLYDYSLSLIGLCVFGMFLYAGLRVMIKGDIGTAKKIFWDAAIGVVLLYSAVLILNSINPDLVSQQADTGTAQTR